MCIPSEFSHQAISAPNVTISPWAKLVRPVVPKISERPDRAHRDHQAEPDAVGDALGVALVRGLLGTLTLAGEEVDDPAGGDERVDVDRLFGLDPLGQLEVVGQRVLVEAHRVIRSPGHRDGGDPPVVGDGCADLVAAFIEHGHGDTWHRLVVGAAARIALLILDLDLDRRLVLGRCRLGERHHPEQRHQRQQQLRQQARWLVVTPPGRLHHRAALYVPRWH